ncbi:hypothetical protein FB451DRAFT_1536862 [Mycena latifolia]|nr:hypothetical protein FB451DRAFT_1536862 [Mycena latifolia]
MNPSYMSLSRSDLSESHPLSPLRHKEAPLPPPPVRPGIGFWVPLCICGGTLLAGILAILHHFFDSSLNGRTVSGYWTQSKSSQIEIFIATAFKILFTFSAGISLCQVSWHSMRRQPLPLGDINALLNGPSIMTLPRLNLLFQAPASLAISAIILATPLITIFAPSLTVRQDGAVARTLTVPTLNLTTDAVLQDFSVGFDRYGALTSTWDKAALMGILSESTVGWPMPDGCSPECEYNITYAAPALRCTDLSPDQIDDGIQDSARWVSRTFQSPPSAYLTGYDGYLTSGTASLNFTTQDKYATGENDSTILNKQYQWTLAYLPYSASNLDDGVTVNAAGSVCIFYNATHEVYTHFFNGTQESRVSVTEYFNPLNTTYKSGQMDFYYVDGNRDNAAAGVEGVSFAPGIGPQVHLLSIADALSDHLNGEIVRNGHAR